MAKRQAIRTGQPRQAVGDIHPHGETARPAPEQAADQPGLGGLAEIGHDQVTTQSEHVTGRDQTRARAGAAPAGRTIEDERTLELREERLVARKDLREVGEAVIRTVIEEAPSRLEVEAYREEVEVEHVPVGEVVSERKVPWEEDGVTVIPVYEEQLVVAKRLVLKEHLRVRRVANRETRLFEDTVRRERLVVEDPANTGLVRERYATVEHDAEGRPRAEDESLMERLGKKILE